MGKVVLMASLLLVACGDETKSKRADAQSVNEVQTIRVEPELLTIITGPDAAGQQDFDAFAVFTDGTETPLEVVSWEVSNKSSGTIDEAGRFTASSANGGETWITATLDDVEGKATVTVRYVDEVNDEGIDPSIFDRPEYESEVSSWVYPPQGVSLPRNTPSIFWQWDDPGPLQPYGSPAEAYRLKFNSSQTQITWYTSALDLLLDETTWASIASTNAGGTVHVELSAALYDKVIVQEPLEVNVQRLDATGSVIYWSTTQQGLVEIPFGGTATDLITSAQTGRCLGCHAVSSQGVISFAWDGSDGTLGLYDWTSGQTLMYSGEGNVANWQSFSPDGNLMVGTSYGNLDLYDSKGTLIRNIASTGNITHPDWAPDDTALVFTLSDGHTSDLSPGTGNLRIARMLHYGNGDFGPIEVLYESPAGWKSYYPSYSPDGAWIAFNQSTGDGNNDVDAELWLMPSDGSADPIRLNAANDVGSLTNSLSRWAPLPDDEVLWLAFASQRNYGRVTSNLHQIWVTAIDPSLAANGEDPSYPAFWLPGQSSTSSNHIPLWTE